MGLAKIAGLSDQFRHGTVMRKENRQFLFTQILTGHQPVTALLVAEKNSFSVSGTDHDSLFKAFWLRSHPNYRTIAGSGNLPLD